MPSDPNDGCTTQPARHDVTKAFGAARAGLLAPRFNELAIRPALPSDDWAVGELLVEAFQWQYAKMMPSHTMSESRKSDLRNQSEKRANATVLVAELRDEIVGTVSLYPWNALRSEAWIEGAVDLRLLGVRSDYQGHGLSSRLLDEAEFIARSWGASAICLHVRRYVEGVARLYQSRGYMRDQTGDLDRLPEVFLEAFCLMLSRQS
jgi:predicted N-acetyltransferase YhbS